MSLILSLESSVAQCSVALHESGKLINALHTGIPQSHASQLAVMVRDVFEGTGSTANDLGAVAVSAGPGSYTGLRIGLSTAKGLCFGLSLPLIAINSLHVIAERLRHSGTAGDLLCPMIDARRMEVYTTVLNRSMEILCDVHALVVEADSFGDLLQDHSIVFGGDGSSKVAGIIGHPNAFFLRNIVARAEDMGRLSYEKYREKDFVNVSEFEPFYLKEFAAKKSASPFTNLTT